MYFFDERIYQIYIEKKSFFHLYIILDSNDLVYYFRLKFKMAV